MSLRRVLMSLLTISFTLSAALARAEVAARVAVLPFEVYTDARNAALQDTIAHELSTLLAQEEGIAVVDRTRITALLDGKTPPSYNEVTLRNIAVQLAVPFLVLGSMTKIGENLSLDTYLFTAQGTSSFSKDFTEGKNLNSLIEKMAKKISVQVLELARASSEGQKATAADISAPDASKVPLPEKTDGEESLPLAAEQVSPVVPPEPVHSEVEGETAAVDLLSQQAPAAAVSVRPPTAPDNDRAENLPAQLSADPGTPPPTGEHIPPEAAEDAALSSPGEGKQFAVARLPVEDADRISEQPQGTDTRKRKDKSLSSPFSTMKPIQITSKSMEADNKENLVTFRGNVVVKQEDIVILSDMMKVAYESKGGISSVEASGNVKMSQENRVATGKKLVFYNAEQKIVLTGNAKIWQGDNLISCEKVTVLLEEDKIFFEGTVDSIIYPKSLQEQDSTAPQAIEEITLPSPAPTSNNGAYDEHVVPLRGEGDSQDTSH